MQIMYQNVRLISVFDPMDKDKKPGFFQVWFYFAGGYYENTWETMEK